MVQVFGVQRELDVPLDKFPSPEELEKIEREALISHCEHGWYDSAHDNVKLHYRYFLPSNKKPQAVLVFQHGICVHGGNAWCLKSTGRKLNMSLLSEACLKEDIAVYAPDMYGQGYSEGTRFLIPSWETNFKDLLAFMDLVSKKHEGVPLFLMGESYGGTLSIHTARYYQDNPAEAPNGFRGILLAAPAIEGDMPIYPVYFVLRYMLAPFFPEWSPPFMPDPVCPERVWRDPEVLELRLNNRLVEAAVDGSGRTFRLGTALNLVLALEECREKAIPGFKQPYCIAHGAKDEGVPVTGSDYMFNTTETPNEEKKYLRFEDALHDLLADPVAEETMDFFMKWMKSRINTV